MDIEELETRLKIAEDRLAKSAQLTQDLVEYLERIEILHQNPQALASWYDDLMRMRHEDRMKRELEDARSRLERAGYIVAQNENELDVQRMKKWLSSKEDK